MTSAFGHAKKRPEYHSVPIGKPIANTQLFIADENLLPLPIGVAGKLYIGGQGLARGYFSQPALTADKFLPNPFSKTPGERFYDTGDIARYRSDGAIDYIGRSDNQVKIRGFRIESGEIENALNSQECIRESVVIARKDHHAQLDGASNQYLVAYLVSKTGAEIDQTALRQAISQQLTDYMIPALFVTLEALPLTPNGKVDRKALPAPDTTLLPAKDTQSPRTETERALVAIWATILRLPVDQIGIADNFFELGGHSLLVTRVVSQLRQTFHIELQIRELFAANTVQTLAVLVEQAITDGAQIDRQTQPLIAIDRQQALPLSFAQQRLWFLNQFEDGDDTQYNIPWVLRLEGPLHTAALENAFHALIHRHEGLRTTFHTREDTALQVIAEQYPLALSIVDIAEAAIPVHLHAQTHRRFNLSAGPLWEVQLLRLSSQTHLLLVNMHHIITDGWSIGVFNEELTTLYAAYNQGRSPTLPPLPIQYADFAHWQRHWLQGEVLEQQVAYWQQQLAGAPALLELPTDRPRPAQQSYRGSSVAFTLPAELTQQLRDLSYRENATLFMTLFSGFVMLLARYSGQHDICVGTPIANRQQAELEKLIGFFVNTLVLRAQLDEQTTGIELLRQVKETALSAYAHQDIPFEQLVEVLQPARSLSYSPIFQVMFVLQNMAQEAITLPDITVSSVAGEQTTAKFDLTISLFEAADEISGWIEFNTDLFDPETIERMAGHYRQLLSGMTADTRKPALDLPLLKRARNATDSIRLE